jgi:hypothetical protein
MNQNHFDKSDVARLGAALERLGKAMRNPRTRLGTVLLLAKAAGFELRIELAEHERG